MGDDVGGDLLEVGGEVVHEIAEDVGFVGLEVEFEEHVVGDYDG